MRILAIVDIDDFHWQGGGGQADLLVSCGDVEDALILEAAAACRCGRIFAVKGNHDTDLPFPSPIIDLHLHMEACQGMLFGGFNGCVKYKPRGYYLYEQWEAEMMLEEFPAVDVLIAHNSPAGIHDSDDVAHEGFTALLHYLERYRPKVLIHGHQHIDRETRWGPTRVIDVYGWKVIEI